MKLLRLFLFIISISKFASANPEMVEKPAEVSFAYADRYYIASVLEDVFGKAAQPFIRDYVLKNGNIFGGACDIYEQVRVEPEKYLNAESTRCFNGKHEYAYPVRTKPSLLREAWTLKVCNSVVANKDTFAYAKTKIKNPQIETEGYLNEVQALFDPNFENNPAFNATILKKLKKLKSDDDKIKYILFQNCIYPAWQII
ncbi:MAG: hypothetical protein ACXVAX_09925 [Pseudobdellovibrio sp.]